MALPTAYTEAQLALFMRGELKTLCADLGWQSEPFTEEINDLLIEFGVTTADAISDIALLRAKARIVVWDAAVKATVGDYDTSSQQDADKRSQVHAQAKVQRAQAQAALQKLLTERASDEALEAQNRQDAMLSSGGVSVVSTW